MFTWNDPTEPEAEPPAPPQAEPDPVKNPVQDEPADTATTVATAPAEEPPPTGADAPVVDPVHVLAAVVTAASAAFTAWSVWDGLRNSTPDALALGLGVGVEALWLLLLAIEWRQAGRTGRVSPYLTGTGWFLAVGAAAVLLLHGLSSDNLVLVALAVFPIASKAGWAWLTYNRMGETLARRGSAAADRQREVELSIGLTPKQEVELAQIRREAVYAREKARAENELTIARAEADRFRQKADTDSESIRQKTESEMRQASTALKVNEQITLMKANATLAQKKQEIEWELALTAPRAVHAGHVRAPNDPSGIATQYAQAGFGAAFANADATGSSSLDLGVPHGATPFDLGVPHPAAPPAPQVPHGATGMPHPATGVGHSATPPAPERTWPRPANPEQGQKFLLEYLAWRKEVGGKISRRDAAERLGKTSTRSVGRYREYLETKGCDMSALPTKDEQDD